MPRAVLDMMDRRLVWAMPDWVPHELEEALPEDWELVVINEETDGSGDGITRVAPSILAAVAEAEMYFGFGIPAELLEAGPGLKWVHSGAAGVGKSLSTKMLQSPVIFTNSAYVHAPPIAETVLGMILFFFRGLDFAVEGQAKGEWLVDKFYAADAPILELPESTIGILGFGGIGKEVARRVSSLGARVIALKRTKPKGVEFDLEAVSGGGGVGSSIELLQGSKGLERLLRESDALVLTAPLTPETRGIIDEEAILKMKEGAILINVARGKLVDQEALVKALQVGRLRGAGLDVFAEEPLPEAHPLWELQNVILTPHVSAVTRGFWRREMDLIKRNIACFFEGAPLDKWKNVVDKQAGY
ncbi:MAG: D-2-hydroxyacid dehydrogenase [Gemmatimonadota bacterium]|nr:D-2-hydroxyacid dehydrogenase [Gemmatimonadota bacterium]